MMLRRFGSTFRHLVRDERGNVLALTAVGLPILLGCAALAVDTAQWVFAKRELPAAADAAAIAGVYGLIQTGDMETAVDRSIASDNHLDPTRAVTAEKSPDAFKDDPFAVRVRIASAAKMTFTSFFLSRRPTIAVEATATVVENGEFCAFAIGRDQETGLAIEPSSNVEMDCGIATNASSATAIEADGSATIDAENIVAF